MLYSEVFKNYYPVKDASVLWYMSQVEREKLCGWMSKYFERSGTS